MRIHDITTCDVNNGEGFRVTLWVAGCSHHCHGCQNPETWDPCGGQPFGKEAHDYLFKELSKSYIQGLTLSGGDPLDSYDDILTLAREIKTEMPEKIIWVYTGYTMEQILVSSLKGILPYVDVIVDGPYIESERDVTLAFRGSRNQRIIRLRDGEITAIEGRPMQS